MNWDGLFSKTGLSLDRMKTFLEVAEAGNIAKAVGTGDPNRQSQFSRQVKELEGFFGVQLTRKVGRRLEVTEEGKRLARMIRGQFQELNDFGKQAQNEPRVVTLGSGASVLQWFVIPRLKLWMKKMCGVTLELRSGRSAENLRAIADGRLDLGLVREDAVAGMEHKRVVEIGYRLFVPAGLRPRTPPRSGKAWVEFLAATPRVRLVNGGRFREVLDEMEREEGFRSAGWAEVSSFLQVAEIIKSGQAVGFLPEIAEAGFAGTGVKGFRCQLLDHYRRQLCLVWNPGNLERRGFEERLIRAMLSLGSAGT